MTRIRGTNQKVSGRRLHLVSAVDQRIGDTIPAARFRGCGAVNCEPSRLTTFRTICPNEEKAVRNYLARSM